MTAALLVILKACVVAFLALAGTTAVALGSGHALGGPDREDRTALAVSCATRHVGVAMLAASAVPGPRTVAFVLAYLVSAAVVTIPYLKWRGRRVLITGGLTGIGNELD
jgi:hypothetical protein